MLSMVVLVFHAVRAGLCPTGTSSGSGDECQPCPGGRFKVSFSGGCLPCARGKFSMPGAAKCESSCPTGRRKAKGGSCEECPPGYFIARGASQTCAKCPGGKFSAKQGATACEDLCMSGQFSTKRGMKARDPSSCKDCRAGKFQPSAGAHACKDCPAGRFFARRGNSGRSCTACEAGRFAEVGQPSCTSCPPGRHSESGATSPTCGGTCPAGRYGLGGSISESCTGRCASGRYGLGGSSTAQCDGPCQANHFGIGGSFSADCDGECPAGKWSQAGMSKCLLTPAAARAKAEAGAKIKAVAAQMAKAKAAAAALKAAKRAARRKTEQAKKAAAAAAKAAAEVKAAAGTTPVPTLVGGLASPSCGAGQQRKGGEGYCSECSDGQWSAGGQGAVCAPCKPGRYGLGASTASECSAACPAGRFGSGGSKTADCTGACPPGRYGLSGSTSEDCDGLCPAGRYGIGGSFAKNCDAACAVGRYSQAGAARCSVSTGAPTPLPTRMPVAIQVLQTGARLGDAPYLEPVGSVGALAKTGDECMLSCLHHPQCTIGTFEPKPGNKAGSCLLSSKVALQAMSCKGDCVSFKKVPASAKLRANTILHLKRCPAGMFRAKESGVRQSKRCSSCPRGQWSAGGIYFCKLCAAGRYGLGASSDKTCSSACPAGRYSTGGSQSADCTGPCPAGRYGLGGSASKHCDGRCPAGRYGSLASSSSDCDGACPAGRHSAAGASSCVMTSAAPSAAPTPAPTPIPTQTPTPAPSPSAAPTQSAAAKGVPPLGVVGGGLQWQPDVTWGNSIRLGAGTRDAEGEGHFARRAPDAEAQTKLLLRLRITGELLSSFVPEKRAQFSRALGAALQLGPGSVAIRSVRDGTAGGKSVITDAGNRRVVLIFRVTVPLAEVSLAIKWSRACCFPLLWHGNAALNRALTSSRISFAYFLHACALSTALRIVGDG